MQPQQLYPPRQPHSGYRPPQQPPPQQPYGGRRPMYPPQQMPQQPPVDIRGQPAGISRTKAFFFGMLGFIAFVAVMFFISLVTFYIKYVNKS